MSSDSFAQADGLYRAGELAAAERECAALLRREPGHRRALDLAVDLAFDTGNFEDAIELLGAGTAAHPDDAMLEYKLGALLEQAGRLEDAADSYRAAIELDPGIAKAHNNLGSVLQQLGDPGQPLQPLAHFERALALDPQLWQAHYNIGNFHQLRGDLAAAMEPFQQAMRLRRAVGPALPDSQQLFAGTSRSKLIHDAEQLEYLVKRGRLPAKDYEPVAGALRRATQVLERELQAPATDLPLEVQGAAADYYNRVVHYDPPPALPGPAVNPKLDRAQVEADYARNAPGIIFVDDFLVPEALAGLRRFCLESTVWFDFQYRNGYVGAMLEQGFICPLLVQIAEELRRAFPAIFGEHKLTHLWAYKYDSQRAGINEHADFAAVNVNFWITPDDANLEPGTGGLIVWDQEAPLDWDFAEYNDNPERIRAFLRETGAKATNAPYRQNRVVIFNSDLFHKTDSYRFKPGYENRRINITMLFGHRQASEDPALR